MEQYLFKVTSVYADKNKLYEAMRKHVLSLDATLIKDEATREAFIEKLLLKMEQLQKEHSRCKLLRLETTNFREMCLTVEGSWSATFYKVERSVELKDFCLQYFIPDANNPKINL